ncbi:MAG: PrsW family intramembrane metalloprotease [Clostridia bacterium]|nr:PrsW family intramembrane metalloprotease [Clostridia bacterium]
MFKENLKYFLKETLRPRNKEDYKEIFRRGALRRGADCGNEETTGCRVPWLWLRALAFGFILFAIAMLGYRLSRGAVDYMTVIVAGGLCVNIPVLIFFYELYPKRDISVILLLSVMLAGGILSVAVITLGYEYIYSDPVNASPWVSTLWTGFWEELCKGAAAITAVALLKKKNPFACFLIGFAVGTGYSVFEDLGYIYAYSGGQRFHWVILMALGRGLSCAFSHAPWTGLICWAFAKFKKPFLNFRFYLAVLASMVLHYLADVTFFVEELDVLSGITWGWAIDAFVVIAIILLQFFILRAERRALASPICAGESGEQLEIAESVNTASRAAKLSYAGNLTAVLCAFVIGALSLAGCSLYTARTPVYKYFDSDRGFIDYVQEGLPLHADLTRGYDPDADNYSELSADGILRYAVQKQTENGYDYFYIYGFDDGAKLESVAVKIEGAIYYLMQLIVYDDGYTIFTSYPEQFGPIFSEPPEEDGGVTEEPEAPPEEEKPTEEPREPIKIVSFFEISNRHKGYDYESGRLCVTVGYNETDNTVAYIVLGAVAGAAFIGGAAAYITLKIKSRRIKDD